MGPHPAFCQLPYHTANNKKLPWNEAGLCASFTYKVMGFVESPLISFSDFLQPQLEQDLS